jgi:hypothetical protein
VTCALLAGCAARHMQAYPGERRAANEVSVLTVSRMRNHAKISITRIDETSGYNFISDVVMGRNGAVSVAVLPGKHTVKAHIQMGSAYVDGAVWWISQAGRNYELRGSFIGYDATIQVIDLKTGRPVGGVVGSADEPGT